MRATQDVRSVSAADSPSGRRLALVVGNDAYPQVPLRNAINDAKAIAQALEAYGFQVDLTFDTTLKELSRHVDRFATQLRSGDVAMVYYAGHGIQIENENYLGPGRSGLGTDSNPGELTS
jgi:uncharacterized caspase-like protein